MSTTEALRARLQMMRSQIDKPQPSPAAAPQPPTAAQLPGTTSALLRERLKAFHNANAPAAPAATSSSFTSSSSSSDAELRERLSSMRARNTDSLRHRLTEFRRDMDEGWMLSRRVYPRPDPPSPVTNRVQAVQLGASVLRNLPFTSSIAKAGQCDEMRKLADCPTVRSIVRMLLHYRTRIDIPIEGFGLELAVVRPHFVLSGVTAPSVAIHINADNSGFASRDTCQLPTDCLTLVFNVRRPLIAPPATPRPLCAVLPADVWGRVVDFLDCFSLACFDCLSPSARAITAPAWDRVPRFTPADPLPSYASYPAPCAPLPKLAKWT
eukprot:Sspe_Gene.90289::Locus_61879_Transcript_1_1_Confidence_1.000_Length_1020::g.90289::m.90289